WLALQAAVNMAVVMALVPTKGLTLPFVSYGRSSMIISMIALGVLLRATSEARQTVGVRPKVVLRRRRARA
ncbi:MAG: FtsW/RodA/SpoVE family cell cycle protein, partial [Deltaproteobacteria bacterium]